MTSPSPNATPAAAAMLPRPPTTEEVMQCQFSSWYDSFLNVENQRRSNVSIKSIVIRPLSTNFLAYLQSDGVRLPLGATQVSSCVPNEEDEEEDAWSDSSGEKDNMHDNEESPPRQFSFPQLNQQIQEGIAELGGSIVPKLNWSCPKDTTWINNGTLKCQTPGDVYLLLKSSDFVMHDLTHAVEDTSSIEYELVLRKWCNLHPSMEFRCFVYNQDLVAISQRHHTQHFPHLARDRVVIHSQIIDFFDTVIEDRFPLANYVFDVYIDKKERVWLIDFNVWGTQTDSLLYSWEELVTMTSSDGEESNYPVMRVVETEREVHHDPLASYRAPIDTVELAAVAGNDRNKFEEFMALCERPSEVTQETYLALSHKRNMIEVVLNDRLGKKCRVKCNEDDTIGDLKKLAAAQLGTRPEKLKIQKWYTIYKDHITLEDYEIHDGMSLELYYQ